MQGGLLELASELLNGIGPGCVGGQPADLDAQPRSGGQHDRVAMHRPVVPDQDPLVGGIVGTRAFQKISQVKPTTPMVRALVEVTRPLATSGALLMR